MFLTQHLCFMKKINNLLPDNRLFFYCGSILISELLFVVILHIHSDLWKIFMQPEKVILCNILFFNNMYRFNVYFIY